MTANRAQDIQSVVIPLRAEYASKALHLPSVQAIVAQTQIAPVVMVSVQLAWQVRPESAEKNPHHNVHRNVNPIVIAKAAHRINNNVCKARAVRLPINVHQVVERLASAEVVRKGSSNASKESVVVTRTNAPQHANPIVIAATVHKGNSNVCKESVEVVLHNALQVATQTQIASPALKANKNVFRENAEALLQQETASSLKMHWCTLSSPRQQPKKRRSS